MWAVVLTTGITLALGRFKQIYIFFLHPQKDYYEEDENSIGEANHFNSMENEVTIKSCTMLRVERFPLVRISINLVEYFSHLKRYFISGIA